jgi:hypothetical protein
MEPEIHYSDYKSSPPVSTLTHMNQAYNLGPYFIKTHFVASVV